MTNLNDKKFTKYFVDLTYKSVPYNLGYKALLLIIGYYCTNDNFELCSAILLK